MTEGKKSRKFRIKWWWDSDDERNARKDPEYAEALEKANEVIEEKNLNAEAIQEKKDVIVGKALEETRKENTELKDVDSISHKNQKNNDNSNRSDQKNNINSTAVDQKNNGNSNRSDQKNNINSSAADQKNNDPGFFDNWFGRDVNDKTKTKNEPGKRFDPDHKPAGKNANEEQNTVKLGENPIKDKSKAVDQKESKDDRDEAETGKEKQKHARNETGDGYFSNWFKSDPKKNPDASRQASANQNNTSKSHEKSDEDRKAELVDSRPKVNDKGNGGVRRQAGNKPLQKDKDISKKNTNTNQETKEGWNWNWFGNQNEGDSKRHKPVDTNQKSADKKGTNQGSSKNEPEAYKYTSADKKHKDQIQPRSNPDTYKGTSSDKNKPDTYKDTSTEKKNTDQNHSTDKSSNNEEVQKQSNVQNKPINKPTDANKKETNKNEPDQKQVSEEDKKKDENKQTKEKSSTLMIVCGSLNIILIFCFLFYTEIWADCTVIFNTIPLICLIVGIVPFLLIPLRNSNLARAISILSVIATCVLLIYLFLHRVIVYYYQISVESIDSEEIRKIEGTAWEKRNEALFDALHGEGFYIDNWIMNSKKKGVKLFILKKALGEEDKEYLYDHNEEKNDIKSIIVDPTDNLKPVIANSVVKYAWSKEKAERILSDIIKTTKFSKLGMNYGLVLGVFDSGTDFGSIVGSEPISIDPLPENEALHTTKFNKQADSKI